MIFRCCKNKIYILYYWMVSSGYLCDYPFISFHKMCVSYGFRFHVVCQKMSICALFVILLDFYWLPEWNLVFKFTPYTYQMIPLRINGASRRHYGHIRFHVFVYVYIFKTRKDIQRHSCTFSYSQTHSQFSHSHTQFQTFSHKEILR